MDKKRIKKDFKSKYMNLLTDYAFKLVFGSEKNKSVLINFLNAALQGKEEIIDVEFRDKEMLPFIEDGKRMVFDIYCTTTQGTHIIIEMQRTLQPSFANRALAYCTNSLLKQILRGKKYYFEKVYGIFIMNFHLVDKAPQLIRRITLMDEDTKEPFSDRLNMIFFDLSSMTRRSLKTCKNDLERRLYLLKNMEKMTNKPKEYSIYDDLFDAADLGHLTNEEVVSYGQSRMKLEDDREGLHYYGRMEHQKGVEEGEKRGLEQGLKEGLKEGQRLMLKGIIEGLKNKGMSLKEVIAILGLPEADIKMVW